MNKELKISARRLKELERMEAKLNALESGGVDNWDCYDDALKDYHIENEKEKDELIEKYRIASKILLYDMEESYSALRDKTTDYANQIKEMIKVHKKVV